MSRRLLTIADRIRSRASRSAVSGRPTSSSPTRPFSMSASISTGWPSHADQRDRVGAGQRHLAHPADVLDREVAGTGPSAPPTTSMRISSKSTPCAITQLTASRRSRRRFCRVMASSGVPYPVAGPGLHLADDQHPALGGDDVDLALGAPPVAVQYPQTRLAAGARRPAARPAGPGRPWRSTRTTSGSDAAGSGRAARRVAGTAVEGRPGARRDCG